MFAVVRRTAYDPAQLAQVRERLAEFQPLHADQPGYRGTLVVDAGDGRWLTVNLWETQEQATAALPAVGPAVRRLLGPLQAGPSEVLGAGPVVLTDLARA